MTRRAIPALAASLALCAGVASAATFDFATAADNYYEDNGFEGTFDQVTGGAFTDGGVTVTASATHRGRAADPFLDAYSGHWKKQRFAGLGVCHSGMVGAVSACASVRSDMRSRILQGHDQADDNVTEGEVLTLRFSEAVSLAGLTIRGQHHDLATGTFLLNGVEQRVEDGQWTGDLGAFETWTFAIGGSDPTQLYVNALTTSDSSPERVPAPVPVPAGALMLGSALVALGLRARRKAR